ncbi:MAG TPA: Zn-dependent hydrolase [Steroidobacteraceae bacterium]|nr:Zn-dependent hydrolase [Steroidobacteraceae bacterium]
MPCEDGPESCDGLRIDAARLWASLEEMARIGATGRGGCNRQALTDDDRIGRDHFVELTRSLGCRVTVDEIGNLFARREGTDPGAAPVLIGSHLDTQATGGRFDGVYGVLAGIEVLRTLGERGLVARRPVEVVSWTNEEGCRFAPAMLGSGVVAGAFGLDYAYARADRDGRSVGEELARIGYVGAQPARPRPFAAAFEAHIEQGPILEAAGTTIGVVTGIQGAYWLDVVLTGEACHAGPTPMETRRDPWRAALPIIDYAFSLADERAPWGRTTIGDVKIQPGSRNTVPERLVISIDLRHPEAAELAAMQAQLRDRVAYFAADARVEARIDTVWHMPPAQFDPALIDLIDRTAGELGYSRQRIVSGAGHDSLYTARFAPTAMIFVPCRDGLSHNEAEDARLEDLEAGANVLLHAVWAVARS